MGIDPGLSRCGYGVVQPAPTDRGDVRASGAANGRVVAANAVANKWEAVAAGVIRTPPDVDHAQRLSSLAAELAALMDEFRPQAVAVEGVFVNLNRKSAIGVAQAAGLVLAEAARRGCEVKQYTPTQIKMSVTGYGGATKDQVEKMVRKIASLPHKLKWADAADAVAVALCHTAHMRVPQVPMSGST